MSGAASSWDAVVVGAGHNGLVAANHLADAGWSVLVVDAADHPGGAVHSDTDVHPDFVHDTFSAFYPLGAASPVIQSLDLESYGLTWTHAPAALGHVRDDGSWALLHRDREVTAALLDREAPGDGERWLDLCALWDDIGDPLLEGLLRPFPPVRAVGPLLRQVASHGGLDLVKMLLTPAADPTLWPFDGEGARLLIAGNAGHSDIPLDAPGSGLMGVLMAMLAQTVGFPVPVGGASALIAALVRRLEARGGVLRLNTPATRIVVHDGRAVAVELGDGTSVCARRAVVGAVSAPMLFGTLVPEGDLPRRVRRGMRRFQWDPGTVKVDWALSGAVPWREMPAHAPGTVHVGDGLADLAQSLGQVSAGLVPEKPYLLAGQMTTSDPTRSPAGTESMWAYTHVPRDVRGDAGPDGIAGEWDESERERFADRVQARIEQRAPGFGDLVLARRVLGPHEMEAINANLSLGSINGGTAQLHQQLVLRPVPGLGRAETGIAGLYLGSSSAHPGGGVHGSPGMNAARAALAHDRPRALRGLVSSRLPQLRRS